MNSPPTPYGRAFEPSHVFTLLSGARVPVMVEMRGDPIAWERDGTRWMTNMGILAEWWGCTARHVSRIASVEDLSVKAPAPRMTKRAIAEMLKVKPRRQYDTHRYAVTDREYCENNLGAAVLILDVLAEHPSVRKALTDAIAAVQPSPKKKAR